MTFVKNFNLKKITLKTVHDSYNCQEAVCDSYNCREAVGNSYNCREAVRDSSLVKKNLFLKKKWAAVLKCYRWATLIN